MLGRYGPLIIVLVIALALYIPTLAYPITGDSISFAKATRSLAVGETPESYKMLPALPFFSVPFAIVTGSPALAIRLSTLIFGIVSIVAWFCIGRELFKESRIFPFLILCPYLILFTMFRGLAEVPLICFSLLSVLFFIRAEKGDSRYFYLSGLFFGLASLSRYAGLIIGLSYVLYYVVHRRRPHTRFVLGMILGLAIFATVPVANTLAYGNPFPPAYLEKLSGSGIEQSGIVRFFTFLPIQIGFIIAVTHLFIPHFIKGLTKMNRERTLFLIIIVLGTLFAALSGDAWRYVIPIIPFVFIIAFAGFSVSKNTWLKGLFIAGIIINIVLVPYFVSGQAKDMADTIYAGPVMWGQAGLRDSNAVTWINQNLPEQATLLITHDYASTDPIWSDYIRDDINVMGYAHLPDTPDSFYILYGYGSEDILRYLFIHPNGSVEFGVDLPLQNLYDHIKENFEQTPVFQDSGLPITTVYLIEK